MEALKSSLVAAAKKAEEDRTEPLKSDQQHFEETYVRMKAEKGGTSSSSSSSGASSKEMIPTFFVNLPHEDDVLQQKLREEARAEFLQRRSKALLDNEELKRLWSLLDANASTVEETPGAASSGETEQMIGYEEYKKVKDLAGEKCQPFFTAVVFAKLQQNDPHGRISVMAFFNYVMRKVWLHQTRIGLSLYDVTGQGYVTTVAFFFDQLRSLLQQWNECL